MNQKGYTYRVKSDFWITGSQVYTNFSQPSKTIGVNTTQKQRSLDDFMYELKTYIGYFAYRMLMPNRHSTGSDTYRYGFLCQELDNEIKWQSNPLNYEYSMHDSRIGRFFAIDAVYIYKYSLLS